MLVFIHNIYVKCSIFFNNRSIIFSKGFHPEMFLKGYLNSVLSLNIQESGAFIGLFIFNYRNVYSFTICNKLQHASDVHTLVKGLNVELGGIFIMLLSLLANCKHDKDSPCRPDPVLNSRSLHVSPPTSALA